jgi:UDP-2,3-diacylglucosamine hydrolase
MKKNIYFVSDFHLGADGTKSSAERERQIIKWMDSVKGDAAALYLLGDVFDFWYEYKSVVPKGYVRLLGKLAEWTDAGIPIYFFTGNHDIWMFRYFEEELGIEVIREPKVVEINGKKFYLGHGDGLGKGDNVFKFLKKIFNCRVAQWLFSRVHPNFAFGLANAWSKKSRYKNEQKDRIFSLNKETLVDYANELTKKMSIDYIIFGHRHLPMDITLKNGKSRYLNIGDWVNHNSYAVFDGQNIKIKFFENEAGKVIKQDQ